MRLKWDFATTFPQPTPGALEAGVISDDDAEPQNVRALHGEHARELLAVLHDIDALADARRRGVDPATGNAPRTEATRMRLAKLFETEPGRLERWWQTQIGVYEEVFGSEAADAFAKAVRAWHAGIDVSTETAAKPTPHAAEVKPPASDLFPSSRSRRERPKRIPARLPVPRPLPSAIAAARFGQEENGKPVRPGAHEVPRYHRAARRKINRHARFNPLDPGGCKAAVAGIIPISHRRLRRRLRPARRRSAGSLCSPSGRTRPVPPQWTVTSPSLAIPACA